MSRGKYRQLRSDEEDLWEKVARTATPLSGKKTPKTFLQKSKSAGQKPSSSDEPKFRVAEFRVGSQSLAQPTFALDDTDRGSRIQKPQLNMNRAAFRRMKQGRSRPDARIDLHGMTVGAAHSALTEFLFRAQTSGKRLVLVITGKGRSGADDGPVPTRTGVLRSSLPDWLGRPPLASIVQQVTEAHARHGGSGAFYVYLRRPR